MAAERTEGQRRGRDAVRDRTVFVTGATSGIGRATVELLARAGAHLIVHGRDLQKVARLVAQLAATGSSAQGVVADLASLEETARLAKEVAGRAPGLDVLINNAGVGFGSDKARREQSRDGFELRFAVNYLAPLLLSETLLSRGLPRGVVINVASVGQAPIDLADLMFARGYDGILAYRRSKLALVMMSLDLAEQYPDLQVHALHPGTFLDTNMVREGGIHPLGPASRGAESIMAVLRGALAGGESGRYFDEQTPARAHAQAYDSRVRRLSRQASLELIAPFRQSSILGRRAATASARGRAM
jgi:NAD(P)-dependent dehydrogenase (short-subunit alcohol dehydrogenase family)